uniref:BTB domain-containing protein n=1 Tax=Setaria viridis TaxID=4556 RepID=A0A4U6U171_SETVI|nr:hypothetical protein SEVIR_6G077200v2 [Setaria viridis]
MASVQDNSIVIECKLTLIHVPDDDPITESFCKIEIPPPEMAQQFGMLLDVRHDVSFKIGRESFHAHKLVLAVRSPVFKSQLIGGFMRDKRMQCLQISDMQPSVFKALLHYVYTETLPNMDGADRGNRYEMLCHILEVADLYAIERLKNIRERMLWMDLDVENVAMTLSLPEQQHCKHLANACLEFMEVPEKMDAVVATKGYNELKRDCPSLLFKLWERRVRARRSMD